MEYSPPDNVFDTSSLGCGSQPDIDRAYFPGLLKWNEVGGEFTDEYLIFSTGNDLSLYTLSDPLNPKRIASSSFRVPNAGDSDYDLTAYLVCDGCRYGAANFKAGTVFFDMGTATQPTIGSFVKDLDLARLPNGMTFKNGSTQYLISTAIQDACVGGSGLYIFNSTDPNALPHLQCLKDDSGKALAITGGKYLQNAAYNGGTPYIWGTDSYYTHIFEVTGSGTDLRLDYVQKIVGLNSLGRGSHFLGFDVNLDEGVAVSLSSSGLKTWSVADLSAPRQLGGVLDFTGDLVTMAYPIVWGVDYLDAGTARTYDITKPSNPQPLDNEFWDVTQTWNDGSCLGFEDGGAFTGDGSYLFLARWERVQRFDFTGCGGPVPPTARVTLERWNGATWETLIGDVFPGDRIRLQSSSTGEILSTRIWLTDAFGATLDETLGGATADPLEYEIPLGGTAGEPGSSYAAHVLVSNDVGSDQVDGTVTVDLQPDAFIDFSPAAPLTGDALTLSGTAEGTPAVPDGSDQNDPFSWQVTPPTGEPFTLFGETPDAVALSEAGTWQVELTVSYKHGATAPYSAITDIALPISSVAASFVVTPAIPFNTEDLILDGSNARWSGGVTPNWKWEYAAIGAGWTELTVCAGQQVCTLASSDESQFFDPGTYDFRLTLSNPETQDESISTVTGVSIVDGTVNLDFTWTPTNPEIGQSVGFQITGIDSVNKATWSFGGTNCDGTSQTAVCTDEWISCMSYLYTYATSGVKTVNLTVESNGKTFPAVTHGVSVQSTGTCPTGGGGGGGTTCSYSVSPTSRTVPAAGGSSSISVIATFGCAWSASDNKSWITITSSTSGTGSGTVAYSVQANDGAERVGVITVGGQTHTVTQTAAVIPVDFTWSPQNPKKGETVTFTVTDSRVTPTQWSFGSDACDGTSPVMNCSWTAEICRQVTWEYPGSGWKQVTLTAEEGTKTKPILIDNQGECCLKDGPPDAAMTVAPNPVYTGEPVTFSAGAAKDLGVKTSAIDFQWNPTNPIIGEAVQFLISGVQTIDSAEWDFGGPGCEGAEQQQTCEPDWTDCLALSFKYASAGSKTVKLTINGGQNLVTKTVTVADEGSCDDGGGEETCSYSITPLSKNFTEAGGSGSIVVSTAAGCSWSATKGVAWLTINSGTPGSGSGTVSYSVSANTGNARSATISVAGKKHVVSQDAYDEADPLDTEATEWSWTVTLGGNTVAASTEPSFVHAFEEPGLYTVRLDVANCAGTDFQITTLLVEEPPVIIPEAYVVPSAVHALGSNDTIWRTDLRVFNPDAFETKLTIEYQPENTDNTLEESHKITIGVPPKGTFSYNDILEAIPGIIGSDVTGTFSGSLNISYENGSQKEVPPLIMSRTYNETPDGTLGQFVPAAPVVPSDNNTFFLSGLVHNLYYRTNIRLANMGEESIMAMVQVLDRNGGQLGDTKWVKVEPRSTRQINAIAEFVGHPTFVDIFSVKIDTASEKSGAWGSIVDNLTGDPVLYSPMAIDEDTSALWIPGVAHLVGANDSLWQTDISFFNAEGTQVSADVSYFPSEDEGFLATMTLHNIQPGTARYYVDILLNEFLPGWIDDSKGFFVISPVGDSPLPQVVARTYNKDVASGGTFGQNIGVFQDKDLIQEGSEGYIPGISASADSVTGFRTNLGLLNTSMTAWSEVRVSAYDEGGNLAGQAEIWLEPGQFIQPNLVDRLHLQIGSPEPVNGSVVIEVLHGGPVGAYASVVDNGTQDPIQIPAVPAIEW